MHRADLMVKLTDETRSFQEICAVGDDEVEARSSQGWILIAVTRRQIVEQPVEMFEVWHDDVGHEHRHYPERIAIEVPIFVMGRTEEASDHAKAIAKIKAALDSSRGRVETVAKERDEARGAINDLKRGIEREAAATIETRRNWDVYRQKFHRAEIDLAKAREALGSVAWREIFADEVQEVAENEREAVLGYGPAPSETDGGDAAAVSLTDVVRQADGISVMGTGGQGGQ